MMSSLKKYLGILFMPLAMVACADGISVSDAYIRGLPPGQTVTAAFMTMNNPTDQACQLVGASSPIASSAEIHVHLHQNGTMSMRPVNAVELPAGEALSFKPGGYHLMLFGLQENLREGDEHSITLFFKGCPELTIVAPVQSVLHENGS
jgi:periplasmic copper chaperone A